MNIKSENAIVLIALDEDIAKIQDNYKNNREVQIVKCSDYNREDYWNYCFNIMVDNHIKSCIVDIDSLKLIMSPKLIVQGLVEFIKYNTDKKIQINVIDNNNIINETGRTYFTNEGIVFSDSVEEIITNWLAKRFHNNINDPGQLRVDNISMIPSFDENIQNMDNTDETTLGIAEKIFEDVSPEENIDIDDMKNDAMQDVWQELMMHDKTKQTANNFMDEYNDVFAELSKPTSLTNNNHNNPPLANDTQTVDWDGYSGNMTQDDMSRIIKSYRNPSEDYSTLNNEISSQKGGRKLFGKLSNKVGGNNGLLAGEVNTNDMYESEYIKDVFEANGDYDAPAESQIITVHSSTGGVGKTTVATMLASQLEWYFNAELLMNQSTSQRLRVLVISMNEFDDIAVKGIGFSDGNPLGLNNNSSPDANVAGLKAIIDDKQDQLEWSDIEDCFVINHNNWVSYLPSLTMQEKFERQIDITANDWKRILDVCKRFFHFIIIDTSDLIFDQRNGLPQFAINNSDVFILVIEPNAKSTGYLYQFLNGLQAQSNKIPLDKDKTMLVINKVPLPNSPYVGYTHHGYIQFADIANSCAKQFCKIDYIPYTDPWQDNNILFGYDPKVKQAARNIADNVLEIIDTTHGYNSTEAL